MVVECKYCRGEFEPRDWKQVYCSRECAAASYRTGRKRLVHTEPCPTCHGPARRCKVCRDWFFAETSRLCCSKACNDIYRAQQKRKRGKVEMSPAARKRSAESQERRRQRMLAAGVVPFDPQEIYDRDEGICGICGDLVEPDRRWPDVMGRSIDHIVPVALGGRHCPENVRLAHWLCNVKRGVADAETGQRPSLLCQECQTPRTGRRCYVCRPLQKRGPKPRKPPKPPRPSVLARPCKDCGVTIEPTGRRGRPRRWCAQCRPSAKVA